MTLIEQKAGQGFWPDQLSLVELPGIEPASLPGQMPSELLFRYVSFRFSPARYLWFRSRVLTASRAGRGERQHLVETRNEALGKDVVVGNRAGVHVDA